MSTNPTVNTQFVTGTDWLADVSATTAPVGGVWYDSYPVNPAEPWTFPRLANIASQYQKYTCANITLIYTPSCATTQKGTIYMAPLRDPTDPVPETPQLMSGLSGCVRAAVRDRCAVSFRREQMSQALNGFYCGASKGIAPDDDDKTKTCGRFVVMLDGVTQQDLAVGTLSLQYSFTLSDPKVAPAGASLYGSVLYDAITHDVPAEGETMTGSPAIVPYETGIWRKRTTCPVLLALQYVNTGVNPPKLSVSGTILDPSLTHHDGNNWFLLYRIAAGRHVIELNLMGDDWTDVEFESWSVGAH